MTSTCTLHGFTPASVGQQIGEVSFTQGKEMGMNGKCLSLSQSAQGIDSLWIQIKPVLQESTPNSGNFTYWRLTQHFSYRSWHWGKTNYLTLRKTPFLPLPKAQFKSSPPPDPSCTLPHFCPHYIQSLGRGNGWHWKVCDHFLSASPPCSLLLAVPLPQHRTHVGCSPSG